MNRQSLDIGRSLTYMFEEDDWVAKFLIAVGMTLLSFLLIPAFILQGYVIEIIRRVGRNQTTALPAWANWGAYLRDGLMAAIASFVYAIPFSLIICCMSILVSALSDNSSGEMSGASALVLCCLLPLSFVLLAPFLVYPAGLIRYAETGQFNSFFQFGRLWAYIRENGSSYWYSILIIILASIVGGFVPVLGTAWSQFVTGHILGQVMRVNSGTVGGPLPPSEVPAL